MGSAWVARRRRRVLVRLIVAKNSGVSTNFHLPIRLVYLGHLTQQNYPAQLRLNFGSTLLMLAQALLKLAQS
jgi:hypothetical protein